jgi:transposase
MPRYIGCDIHKKQVTVCMLDADGQVLERLRLPCTREALMRFGREALRPDDELVLEATTHTWAVVEVLEPFVGRLVVSNPLRTRAIAFAKVKTDKIDARVLADLLRAGYLASVWQPDAETRRLRGLTHRRAALVADRTAVKNRLHATLAQRLIPVPCDRLFGSQGLQWLRQLPLDEDGRQALDSDLRLLAALEQEIDALEDLLARLAYERQAVRLLMTLPGVDFAVAQGLLAAWGTVDRFPDADHAAAYLGLAPSTRQSDAHCYHGPITKAGNSHARWLLIQAAQHLDSHPGPLGHFFRRLAHKKNRNVAVVAAARKMALIAYHMLTHREPYRYAIPASTQTKLARLRVRVTGQRRRGGVAKGTPRPAAYGTGRPTRAVPGLPEVYHREQLPPPTPLAQLPEAELRHLTVTSTLPYVQQNQQLQHKPRRAKAPPRTAGQLTES